MFVFWVVYCVETVVVCFVLIVCFDWLGVVLLLGCLLRCLCLGLIVLGVIVLLFLVVCYGYFIACDIWW